MRGDDPQQNHMFSYLSPEMRVRKDRPLRAIWAMVRLPASPLRTDDWPGIIVREEYGQAAACDHQGLTA
ncbi:MAG: hypothetical protein WB762_23820 [Candidatus Sulfotelmatobacter sp.]